MTTKDWGIVVAVGTIVGTITGAMTLMMHVMERVHQLEVALIKAEAEAAQARIKAEAEAAQARIKAEAKADAARLQDKVEMYRYYVQALRTRDHEPLEEALSCPYGKKRSKKGPRRWRRVKVGGKWTWGRREEGRDGGSGRTEWRVGRVFVCTKHLHLLPITPSSPAPVSTLYTRT